MAADAIRGGPAPSGTAAAGWPSSLPGGAAGLRCVWGRVAEGAALAELLEALPASCVHEVR